jgi:hypothetical protein
LLRRVIPKVTPHVRVRVAQYSWPEECRGGALACDSVGSCWRRVSVTSGGLGGRAGGKTGPLIDCVGA